MDELQAFRNEISNYNFYVEKIIKIKEEIDDKYYELFGVRGVDPSKESLENKNNNAIELKRLESIEKFDLFKKEKEDEIKRLKSQIDYILKVLNQMDPLTSKIFISIYINNKSYAETCLRLNLIDSDNKPKIGELQYIMKKAFM